MTGPPTAAKDMPVGPVARAVGDKASAREQQPTAGGGSERKRVSLVLRRSVIAVTDAKVFPRYQSHPERKTELRPGPGTFRANWRIPAAAPVRGAPR